MFLSYTTLQNNQQIVRNLDEVVQLPFFDVEFHREVYKDGLVNAIENFKDSKEVSAGVEVSNSTGSMLLTTHCTVCHYNLCYVKKSFLDVQLHRKVKQHTQEYQDLVAWLLTPSDDNPWSAAVSQLIIVKESDSDFVSAVIQPTVSNIPDKALFCNFIIALRMGTEGRYLILPEFVRLCAEGYSKRSAFFLACKKLYNTNHTPFSYIDKVMPIDRYLSQPAYLEKEKHTMSSKCNANTWCLTKQPPYITLEYLTEKEKN